MSERYIMSKDHGLYEINRSNAIQNRKLAVFLQNSSRGKVVLDWMNAESPTVVRVKAQEQIRIKAEPVKRNVFHTAAVKAAQGVKQ